MINIYKFEISLYKLINSNKMKIMIKKKNNITLKKNFKKKLRKKIINEVR